MNVISQGETRMILRTVLPFIKQLQRLLLFPMVVRMLDDFRPGR
jgi:hypothetical protein